jgi:hypothetical protein
VVDATSVDALLGGSVPEGPSSAEACAPSVEASSEPTALAGSFAEGVSDEASAEPQPTNIALPITARKLDPRWRMLPPNG